MLEVTCHNPINNQSHNGFVVAETSLFYKVYSPRSKEVGDSSPDNSEFWPIAFCRPVNLVNLVNPVPTHSPI